MKPQQLLHMPWKPRSGELVGESKLKLSLYGESPPRLYTAVITPD